MPEVIFGIDYGQQRTGIAVGNTASGSATPLTTLQAKNGQPDWYALESLIKEWRPKRIVLGLPADQAAGEDHPMKKPILTFARQCEARFQLPIHTVNEHFSSAEARERLVAQRQMGRKKRVDKRELDAQSAVIMIEQWMSQHAGH